MSHRSSFLRPATTLAVCLSIAIQPASWAFPSYRASFSDPELAESPKADCQLNSARGDIKHVIYIEFGHLQFTRDNPNVPSDLEQMPHLLDFIERNGTLLTNHHTALPSDGTSNTLAALNGVYAERYGQTAGNERSPAPWLPYMRAGCNVGAVALPSMTLQNISGDVIRAFGANSLEAALSVDPGTAKQAAAELEGVAIHCAAGSAACAYGTPDLLPDEARYRGFTALFGYKNVAPVISGSAPLTDLNAQVIADSQGNVGFPGFAGISAAQSLAYVAAMQEHGVPVTFAYISSAHENRSGAFGPGEAGYVAQLKAYDDAFDKFFTRLANDGINQNNTLFVLTANEGDRFAGGAPVPATCDGINIPCTYPSQAISAINLADLIARQDPKLAAAAFDVSPGMAAALSIRGQPEPGSPLVRQFEKAAAKLSAVNPITGNPDPIALFLADSAGLNLLYMAADDPARVPAFVLFANPEFRYSASDTSGQLSHRETSWNHGGLAPAINTTFLGLVAPGINARGIDNEVWSDHTDIRPTMLALLGLKDDSPRQGRVLAEFFQEWALPDAIRASTQEFTQFANTYKKINAPVGELALTTLQISTAALAGADAKYDNLERQLGVIALLRDDLASAMAGLLEGAEFRGRRISQDEARQLVRSANDLLDYVKLVAANGW